MWFATRDGLNRYDGNAFVVYKHNPDDPGSLSHNFIRDLVEDDDGYLWIATVSGRRTGSTPRPNALPATVTTPTTPTASAATRSRASPATVAAICGLAPRESGLDRFDPATETFTHYRDDSDGQFVGRITQVIEDSHREIWFVGERGLFHLNPQTGQITRPPATVSLAADYVYEDDVGNLLDAGLLPDRRPRSSTIARQSDSRSIRWRRAAGLASSKLLADGRMDSGYRRARGSITSTGERNG